MKKNQFIIIVILIVIFVFLSIFLVFIKKENVVYLGNSTKVYIKNGEIIKKEDNRIMNLREAKIYFEGDFIDGYLRTTKNDVVSYNSREAFTKDRKLIVFSDGLLAYTGSVNIKVDEGKEYDILTNKEKDLLVSIAEENKISGDIISASRVDVDINKDKKMESIYSYTLMDSKKISTIVVLVNGDKYEEIELSSTNSKYPSVKRCYLFKLIDFNDDDNYEIVTYCSEGDDSLVKYNIYNYKNGSVSPIK